MYSLILVDDEPEILTGLCNIVKWNELGFHIDAAFSNGEEALEYIKHRHCDAVLSDIRMNGISGLDIADYIKTNLPDTRVILISAYSEFEYAHHAVNARVFGYLLKPTQISHLISLFNELKTELDKKHIADTDESLLSSANPVISSVCSYIDAHLSESISLSQIAQEFHYNSSYLSRLFKSECGVGLSEYTNKARIEKAKLLLIEQPALSIDQLAESVGFHSSRYFVSQFITITGENPSVYRKKHRQ